MNNIEVLARAVGLLVGVGEAPGHAGRDEYSKVDGDGTVQGAVALDELLEIHAIHEFHDHEMLSPDQAEMIGLDNVRVDQVGHEPGLANEVLLKLLDARIFFTY
jgi:hypothetical protein